ncbi:Polyphosphate kinase [Rodentibacter pneumotropicus]|uniref:Polyphosphate kinase n=1 Tax=Rodentibacter pneumotropicus TaxID=758 RepID=A0A3S5ES82_9PAST|nr:Polyphosphate kinase [Rodentibacter pneumotropicus]
MTDNNRFLCREMSLLAFNRRVLAQAQDPNTPLLERLRFVCIVSSNLDEFLRFVLRV